MPSSDLKMITTYENLQPLRRLENHKVCHISSMVKQPETENRDKCGGFRLWPSFNSIKLFILINSFICLNAYIQYTYITSILLGSLYKLSILYWFVQYITYDKPFLYESTKYTFSKINFLYSALVDTISYICITPFASNSSYYLLIPHLFLFEVIFDFFHYWTHRISHKIPRLYKFHKIHHSSHIIQASTTFQHHPVDLLFTNTLPLFIAFWILPTNSFYSTLFLWYKTVQEIGGHSGKKLRGSSFISFIWLPKWFGIELYTKDHALHHQNPAWNFSKRFSLWDKVFGTYYLSK